jgi:hypothetical protein
MGDGITLTVNADTATAAEQLSRFFGTLQASLDKAAATSVEGIGAGIGAGSKVASEGLAGIRHQSMLLHESFFELESVTMLMGGTRFPMLGQAVMAVRMGMMSLRGAAQVTGLGIGTLAPVLGLVGAALVAGVALWRDYTSETEKAAKSHKELMDSMAKLPGMLGQVNELLKARRLSAEAANEYADYLTGKKKLYMNRAGEVTPSAGPIIPPRPAGVMMSMPRMPLPDNANLREATPGEAQEWVKKQLEAKGGMGDPSIEAVNKLKELERQQHEESLEGLKREEAEIHAKYQKQRDEIKKTLEEAKLSMTPKEAQAGTAALALNQKNEASAIQAARFKAEQEKEKQALEAFDKNKQEMAAKATAAQELFELQLTEAALKGGRGRTHSAETEFQERTKFYQGQLYAGEIGESEYTKLTLESSIKRLEGLKKEAEEASRLQKEKEQNAQRAREVQIESISNDPSKSELEKQQQLLPLLQANYIEQSTDLAKIRAQMQDETLSEKELLRLRGMELDLIKQTNQTKGQIFDLQNASAFELKMNQITTDLKRFGELGAMIGKAFQSIVTSSMTAIESNITGAIMKTETWRQALQNIRTTILTSIVQAFVQMGVEWLTTHVFMEGVSIAYHQLMRALALETAATTTAANTSTGAAGAVAGVGTAGAEGGWIGILIYLGVMAAAIAAVTAMFGGFAEGGYTGGGGRYEPAGIVHRGEYVFSAPAVKGIGLGRLDALHSGYASGGAVGGSGGGAVIHNHIWGNMTSEMEKFMQSEKGIHNVVNIAGKNAHRFR